MFEKLIDKVKKTKLFNELEDWWAYSYTISSEGATVELQNYGSMDFDKEGNPGAVIVDESFVVAHVPCKLLTVDEYARLYNVEQGTVRQWIRRGKIRTAKKYGQEWRIPELTDLPGRGYRFGQYKWEDTLTDVPVEYEQFREPAIASFGQSSTDAKVYEVSISRRNADWIHLRMDAKVREKLELFLISHPMVKYISDEYATWG